MALLLGLTEDPAAAISSREVDGLSPSSSPFRPPTSPEDMSEDGGQENDRHDGMAPAAPRPMSRFRRRRSESGAVAMHAAEVAVRRAPVGGGGVAGEPGAASVGSRRSRCGCRLRGGLFERFKKCCCTADSVGLNGADRRR